MNRILNDISQASLPRILILCFIRALKTIRTENPTRMTKIKQRTIKIHIWATLKSSFFNVRLISVLLSKTNIETLAVVKVFLGQHRGGKNWPKINQQTRLVFWLLIIEFLLLLIFHETLTLSKLCFSNNHAHCTILVWSMVK